METRGKETTVNNLRERWKYRTEAEESRTFITYSVPLEAEVAHPGFASVVHLAAIHKDSTAQTAG